MAGTYYKLTIYLFSEQLYEGEEEEEDEAKDRVRLTRLYQFARKVRALLHTYHYNQIFLSEFWGAFSKYTGCEFQPRDYGYSTLDELLAAIPQVSFQILFLENLNMFNAEHSSGKTVGKKGNEFPVFMFSFSTLCSRLKPMAKSSCLLKGWKQHFINGKCFFYPSLWVACEAF